jgi:chromosome segregation ATPase
MVTIEQVRQLESRVAKAIDYVNGVTGENTLLKAKLDSYQRRIEELEVLIQRFKEDQGRIEECIVAALERLNRFEDDVQKTMSSENSLPPLDKPRAGVSLEKTVVDAEVSRSPHSAVPDSAISISIEKNVKSGFGVEEPEEVLPDDPAEAASELDIF